MCLLQFPFRNNNQIETIRKKKKPTGSHDMNRNRHCDDKTVVTGGFALSHVTKAGFCAKPNARLALQEHFGGWEGNRDPCEQLSPRFSKPVCHIIICIHRRH
jgi:hypothetical protein